MGIITSILLGLLAGGGAVGAAALSNAKGRKKEYDLDDYDWDSLESRMDWDDLAVWEGLDNATKRAILDQHYTNKGGIRKERIDEDSLLDTLSQLSEMHSGMAALEPEPLYEDSLKHAQGEVDTALAELESLRERQASNLNDELSSLASSYNTSRNAILSSQYQQNAQLMDSMTSQLDKQNRNALEAGASAGMRLAGNINTLLSTQNKQSQTSLETANQLAQMMVNQRNAEASVRGKYGDYMNQHFATQQDIKNSLYSRADAHYNAEKTKYDSNTSAFYDKYVSNPAYDFMGAIKGVTPGTSSNSSANQNSSSSTAQISSTHTPSYSELKDKYKYNN